MIALYTQPPSFGYTSEDGVLYVFEGTMYAKLVFAGRCRRSQRPQYYFEIVHKLGHFKWECQNKESNHRETSEEMFLMACV